MKPTWVHALMELARQPARSTDELARRLRVSQQTCSRWMAQLRKDGLVRKNKDYETTEAGNSVLSEPARTSARLDGTVFSGVGEGKYYLSKKGYQKQFLALLGFQPYPGTLNLRLSKPECLAASAALRRKPGRHLDGFTDAARTYGAARCYPCRIDRKAAGAIIVPERTHYPHDVVEILSPAFLRKDLGLKDGDAVELQLD